MNFLTLTRRDADVAIRPSREAGDALVGRRVSDVAYAIYRARRAPQALPRSDLAQADWVGFEESLAHLGVAKWMAANVGQERIVHRANTMLAIHGAVRAGLGIALLPCFMGDPDPAIERVQGTMAELSTPLWVLTHSDLRRVARIRTVLDFFAGALAARRAVLDGSSLAEANVRRPRKAIKG
jgi:DNA-binding transcriptional LysR family regulator